MQHVAAIERLQMENKALAVQAQKLKAQEQHMRDRCEAVKGQEQQVVKLEQQVVNLDQQVDGLHTKLKDEQKGKEAAVKVSSQHRSPQQSLQKLPYWLLSHHHMTIGLYLSLHLPVMFVITLAKLLH